MIMIDKTLKEIRRKNLRAIALRCGGLTVLAKRINRAQPQLSHSIGANPVRGIGSQLARHIEQVFDKPHGWLDQKNFNADELFN